MRSFTALHDVNQGSASSQCIHHSDYWWRIRALVENSQFEWVHRREKVSFRFGREPAIVLRLTDDDRHVFFFQHSIFVGHRKYDVSSCLVIRTNYGDASSSEPHDVLNVKYLVVKNLDEMRNVDA